MVNSEPGSAAIWFNLEMDGIVHASNVGHNGLIGIHSFVYNKRIALIAAF